MAEPRNHFAMCIREGRQFTSDDAGKMHIVGFVRCNLCINSMHCCPAPP